MHELSSSLTPRPSKALLHSPPFSSVSSIFCSVVRDYQQTKGSPEYKPAQNGKEKLSAVCAGVGADNVAPHYTQSLLKMH